MKKSILATVVLCLFAGYGMGGNETTIANLKAAFKGESTASAKYAAYAEQATKEGLVQIAVMFTATSKSESIHASNHKVVLERLGQKVDVVKPEFTVKTTKENLQDAVKGESYEISTMYPGFVSTAMEEGVTDGAKSMRWALNTEKNHLMFYNKALDELNAGKASTLPKIYWVCPKCGNTFDIAKPVKQCPLCGTASSKYIKFGK
jgi:rubrerythrin